MTLATEASISLAPYIWLPILWLAVAVWAWHEVVVPKLVARRKRRRARDRAVDVAFQWHFLRRFTTGVVPEGFSDSFEDGLNEMRREIDGVTE